MQSRTRWTIILSLVLLAPVVAALALMLWRAWSTEALLPGMDPASVARVEIRRVKNGKTEKPLVLERLPGTGAGWQIASAADAPADGARVGAMLKNLASLRGRPIAAGETAGPSRLEVRLFDARRQDLGGAAFRTELATRLSDGAMLAVKSVPALPDWPSGWTSLKAPRIDVDHVVAVELLGENGPERLPPEAVGQTVAVLLALNAQDFVAGSDVRWLGARSLRVVMDDGGTIDLQQVPDGEGRFFLRLTSDKLPDVRAARRYAFRVERPLP